MSYHNFTDIMERDDDSWIPNPPPKKRELEVL